MAAAKSSTEIRGQTVKTSSPPTPPVRAIHASVYGHAQAIVIRQPKDDTSPR